MAVVHEGFVSCVWCVCVYLCVCVVYIERERKMMGWREIERRRDDHSIGP